MGSKMKWERFLPARWLANSKKKHVGVSTSRIVADLDAIKAEPVGFILHGKNFTIYPLDVEQFLSMTDEYINLMDLKKMESITPQLLVDRYYNCFVKAIPDLQKSDVSNMTQQQCAALYELVMDTITGKVFTEKKKIYQPVITQQEKPPQS